MASNVAAASTTHLLVFGDTAADRLSMIRALVRRSKSSPAARTFLQHATDLLELEVSRLRPDQRHWRTWHSILALAEQDADAEQPTSAFAPTVLACIGRMGDLIVRAEQDPTLLGSSGSPVHVLAFCSGQLAAVPLIAAQDTADLLPIACQIISICVRFTTLTQQWRMDLLAPYETGAWYTTYLGLRPERVQAILDDFHKSKTLTTFQRLFIGVVSEGWLTLVGTPSSFSRLAAWSPEIRDAPHISTDVGGPTHTPYMPCPDIDMILDHSPLLDRTIDWSKAVMSNPTGDTAPYQHATLKELLGQIMVDILKHPLRIDKTTKACTDRLCQGPANITTAFRKVKVHEIGSIPHLPLVEKMLKAVNCAYELAPPCPLPNLLDPSIPTMTRASSDLVAIVGMSGRFPENESIDGFWADLMAGKCLIKKIPKSRFDVDRYYDATHKLKNSTAARHGGWLLNPGQFDNQFFNISPREAMQLDPVARLALTTTHEALEMAGYSPGATRSANPDRVATFFGTSGMDWADSLYQQGLDIYAFNSITKAFITGRLNHMYKFGRGSYSLDAACASSTTAITLAVQGLISHDCDMALAGGASVFSSPFAFAALSRSGMLASEAGCRTFHDDADGYTRSEGVGMLVLKRLEDATVDNDHVLGVVRGSARAYSTSSTSITHPSHVSQERIFREVLGQTAVDPEEIAYVEMHGTGTQAGDLEEMTSVLNVVGGHRNADNPLSVGAVKAALGHGEGVSGVISVIKALVMLRHGQIPPQPGAPFKVNSNFPRLDRRNVRIALEPSPLQASPKAKDSKIRMLVNSFDASGGTCALVIEEAPARQNTTTPDPRTSHVVAISAQTVLSLHKNCEQLLAYLEQNPGTRIENLAYTTTARRIHQRLRVAFVASSLQGLKGQLVDHIESIKANQRAMRKPKVPPVIFLFTGQGSHYTAMGRTLYLTSKSFRSILATFQAAATALELPEFLPIISNGDFDMSTASPSQVQLAIVALELAITQLLRTWGIVPGLVIGHSLGEYAALCAAGVLSPSDALYLVGRRAQLMEQQLAPDTHAMLAIWMAVDDLKAYLESEQKQGSMASCAIACINSPATTLASGSIDDVIVLKEKLASGGTRSSLLPVPFGFHSAQVDPVLPDLERLAAGVIFNEPNIPIVSSLTGQLVANDRVFNASYLARQARETVNFVAALHCSEIAGFAGDSSLWIEVGPDPALLGLTCKTLDIPASHLLPAFQRDKNNWTTLTGVLKTAYETGVVVQWSLYHREFVSSLHMLPDLPSYAWDYKEYWIPYTSPPAWEVEEALASGRDHHGAGPNHARRQLKGTKDVSSSRTLHSTLEEKVDDAAGTMRVVFESETGIPSLRKVIEDHVVDGHKITPLAVFCEMALDAYRYCYCQMSKDKGADDLNITKMRLRDISLHRPVILDESASPNILTTAVFSAASSAAAIVFHSRTQPDSEPTPVGGCRVVSVNSHEAQLTRLTSAEMPTIYLVKARIEQLRSLAATGQAHHLLRRVVYSLFGRYVKYGPGYHAVDEVVLSIDCQDAVASVTAPATDEEEQHVYNPYTYDGVTHVVGFLINNGLRFDDPEIICITDGFSDSRVWEPLVGGRKYTTYISLHEVVGIGGRLEGDCYVFDAKGDQLVALYSGFRFQKMKKAVLHYVSGRATKSASQAQPEEADAGRRGAEVVMDAHHRGHAVGTLENGQIASADMSSTPAAAPDRRQSRPSIDESGIIGRVFAIIAAEAGCSTEDMTDCANFADLGIDSILAVAVLLRCNNELGLDLPAAFFLEQETVGAARQALAEQYAPPPLTSSSIGSSSSSGDGGGGGDVAGNARPKDMEKGSVIVPEEEGHEETTVRLQLAQDSTACGVKQVTAVMSGSAKQPCNMRTGQEKVQGRRSSTSSIAPCSSQTASQRKFTLIKGLEAASTKLVLFADETGSCGKYSQLPDLGPSLSVHGIDWPDAVSIRSRGDPISIEVLAAAYASSIYHTHVDSASRMILGGFGVGSVLAVEVGRLLGKKIWGVLVLDPSAALADRIRRERDRMKRMRILRPVQEKNMTLASELMTGYRFLSPDSSEVRVAAIVPTAEHTRAESPVRDWLPGADFRVVDLPSGSFLKKPEMQVIGDACQRILEQWNEMY